MSPLHPLFPLIIYLIAFFSAYLIQLKLKLVIQPGRKETIDGLRGFLGIGVFIHHTGAWRHLISTGIWGNLNSSALIQFGETSVAFFFMITGFLFVSKLLAANEKGFNWRAFFISRIFRLVPMYYVSLLLIVLFVMIATHWHFYVGWLEFLGSIIHWCCFTIFDTPLINAQWILGVNAGVEWSLPFEWLFYFSLPLLGLVLLKTKPKAIYILLSVLFIYFFYRQVGPHETVGYHLYAFLGGAISPFLLKYTSLADRVNNIYADLLILICLYIIMQFPTAKNVYCLIAITCAFTLIAMGNSIFGLLKNNSIKLLGDISYSTYLLHGLLLFGVFNLVIGIDRSKTLTVTEYCMIIFSLTPVLVLVSFLGFRFIENPFTLLAKKFNRY